MLITLPTSFIDHAIGEGTGAMVRNKLESKRDPIVRAYHGQLDTLVEAVLSQV